MELAGITLPFPPLRRYDPKDIGPDAMAAAAVAFLAVPQGLAYATIAGLPPVAGLYAAGIPAVLGSLFRSSSHVIAGPTNALSLLVGAAVAEHAGTDPMTTALTLAFMVGVFQVLAGALHLGSLVDYISSPVVLGYITGAGILIGVGQLYNLTGTSGPTGKIWITVGGWVSSLGGVSWMAVAVGAGTVVAIALLRLISRKVPAALVGMILALVVNLVFGLEEHGLAVVSDLAPIPTGLPSLTTPTLGLAVTLLPFAVACTVLSLVESSAIARSVATRSGQRLDSSTEFVGQGLANVAAAFVGGYPVSGSLSRSALNHRLGARTRLAGALAGLLMVLIMLGAGPVLDHTPIASLAGLLFVVAYDLVDLPRIRTVMKTRPSDAIAFVVTTVGTWVLSLDMAIYLGVGISVVLFLRRARLLTISELIVDEGGQFQEVDLDTAAERPGRCRDIRMIHVEGSLFFGAAGELQNALDPVLHDPDIGVVVIRLRRARLMDSTTAAVLAAAHERLRLADRHLLLAGMTTDTMQVLERSGVAAKVGEENLFPSTGIWLESLSRARERAVALTGSHCEDCPHLRALSGEPRHANNS